MPGPLVCHNCGKDFSRTSGAGLFCSKVCAAAYPKKVADAKQSLIAAGFTQDGELYRKDGVHLTPQKVIHVGLEKSLQAHAQIAEAVAAKRNG